MSRMRRSGLLAVAAALATAALGCGGSAGPAIPLMAPDAPEPVVIAPGEAPAADAPVAVTAPPPEAPAAIDGGAARALEGENDVARPQPKEEAPGARPGLGTEWGETRASRITTAPFVRADPANPFAIASVFYNDEQGARAMAGIKGFQRTGPEAFAIADGAVQIGLRAEDGRFLSGFVAEGDRFVVGEHGVRYTIVLRNLTDSRFECVVSVDGLDVIDGQVAAFSRRGYLLEPHGELEIDGFRQSMDEVAAFRFGSVRSSYAGKKHGTTRNVGVIGVAFFHERGVSPWTPEEIRRRQSANPFPGQLATPP